MKNKKLVSLTLTAIMALSATAFAACGGGEDFTNDPTTWESLQSGEMVKIVFAGRDVDSEKINYQNFLNEFNQTNEYGTHTHGHNKSAGKLCRCNSSFKK